MNKNFKIIINTERCKDCGLCVYYCPKKCLQKSKTFNKAGYTPVEVIEIENCSGCGNCYIMCPDWAIAVEQKASD